MPRARPRCARRGPRKPWWWRCAWPLRARRLLLRPFRLPVRPLLRRVVVAAGPGAPTFAAVTRTVRVPVSVLDKDGQPVLGLKGPEFRVSENGKPQPVTLFSGERRPLRIALALDLSGSMQSKVGEVQSALRRFIDLLEPSDQIMVLGLQRPRAHAAGLHVRSRAPGPGLRHAGARGRDGALRRGFRVDPPRGRRGRREQGGGAGERRGGHVERRVLLAAPRVRAPVRGARLLHRPRRRECDLRPVPSVRPAAPGAAGAAFPVAGGEGIPAAAAARRRSRRGGAGRRPAAAPEE